MTEDEIMAWHRQTQYIANQLRACGMGLTLREIQLAAAAISYERGLQPVPTPAEKREVLDRLYAQSLAGSPFDAPH